MEKQSTSEDESRRLMNYLRPDTLGQLFGAMAVTGASSFLLAFFGLFAYVILWPDSELTLFHPIIVVGIASWACVVVSLWGYVIWATPQLQKLPQESDLYEKRKSWVYLALGFGILALLAPLGILFGSP